ncbi:MAG: hypothetical protein WC460_06790 [Patescibacteria group bacterium]
MNISFDGTGRGARLAAKFVQKLKDLGFEAEPKIERTGPLDPAPNQGPMTSIRIITNAPNDVVKSIDVVNENKRGKTLCEILSLNEQQDTGVVEEQVNEAFKAAFSQFKIKDNSIKIEKFDSVKGTANGTLTYTVANMNIHSPFVFNIKDKMLVLGEE